MKRFFFRAALAGGLAILSGWTIAAAPVSDAQWSGTSIGLGYHESVSDAGCLFAGLGASNTWNAAGSKFSILADVFYSHPRVSQQTEAFNYKNITIEDAVTLSSPAALMETKYKLLPGTLTLQNADVYVIKSRLDSSASTGKFYCLSSDNIPADQVDFESALLHEIGHALGFQLTSEYFFDNTCAMYYGLMSGEKRRTLCAGEKQEYLDVYGTP